MPVDPEVVEASKTLYISTKLLKSNTVPAFVQPGRWQVHGSSASLILHIPSFINGLHTFVPTDYSQRSTSKLMNPFLDLFRGTATSPLRNAAAHDASRRVLPRLYVSRDLTGNRRYPWPRGILRWRIGMVFTFSEEKEAATSVALTTVEKSEAVEDEEWAEERSQFVGVREEWKSKMHEEMEKVWDMDNGLTLRGFSAFSAVTGRETGPELHTLTAAMTEIQVTLGGGNTAGRGKFERTQDCAVRLSASVYLKNLVKLRWEEDVQPLAEQDKATLRLRLVPTPSLPSQLKRVNLGRRGKCNAISSKSDIHHSFQLFVKLYTEQLLESNAVPAFFQGVWSLVSDDPLVSQCLRFLSTAIRPGHYTQLFITTSAETISTLVEGVVVPNVSLRKHELEQFGDDPLEFIHLDLSIGGAGAGGAGVSNEGVTRRQAAADVVKALVGTGGGEGEKITTSIVGNWIERGLAQYVQFGKSADGEGWKVERLNMMFTSTNALVDVVKFFSDHVYEDLQAQANAHPILQGDAIRFLYTFRNQQLVGSLQTSDSNTILGVLHRTHSSTSSEEPRQVYSKMHPLHPRNHSKGKRQLTRQKAAHQAKGSSPGKRQLTRQKAAYQAKGSSPGKRQLTRQKAAHQAKGSPALYLATLAKMARDVVGLLHKRKPKCTGHSIVFAQHTLIWYTGRQGKRTMTISMVRLDNMVIATLSADDLKDLGELKAELEQAKGSTRERCRERWSETTEI
ncbi:importin-alpha export receptor [Paramarasmius palmivorus]|uniref:Importin-alpha export receptor n=1 Tax=Paramarasmius palmivorus TaxID=297713 RepID=A0AAW0AYT2_9AGAR